MIELKNLSIKYIKDYYSLYNINYTIDKNTLILGNKDDGAFALFRILSKIDTHYTGDVIIDENNLKIIKDKNLDITYVTEIPYLFEHRSIFYNLYYPLKIRKINKNNARIYIDDVLNRYNLKNFPERISKMNLSQKKIITLLRSLVRPCKYVLIENLFTELDDNYHDLAVNILKEIELRSIIVASEVDIKLIKNYNNCTSLYLDNGSIKKE